MRISLFNRAVHWVRAKLGYEVQGAPVPPATVKGAAEVVAQNARIEMARAAEAVSDLNKVPQFYEQLKQSSKSLLVAEQALARGGWEQIRPADLRRLEPQIAQQYARARKFAEDAVNGRYGPIPADNPRFLQRAAMYANQGRAVYENERGALHAESGFTEASRLRSAVDSCEDCIEWEALGWIPVEEMLSSYPIGAARCLSNCHCVIIYRRSK